MTANSGPHARKPASSPTKTELDERDRYAKLTTSSVGNVRSNAQAWRNGLAVFITLVTTGVIIKGPATTEDLAFAWRIPITILVGGGLLLAITGLWLALAAEAGTDPKKQTLQEIRAAYGTLTTYHVHLAAKAANQLQWGRRAVGIALLFFLAGVGITWWAPTTSPPTPIYITVVSQEGIITCGTLQAAAAGQLHLAVSGTRKYIIIPFAQIASLALTATCPA